jgi:hypothetical protein
MYGITGATFTGNPHGKINFDLEITLKEEASSSWQLLYSIRNVSLITEARIFIAIFATFAVKEQYVYVLDVFPVL